MSTVAATAAGYWYFKFFYQLGLELFRVDENELMFYENRLD